MDICYEYVYVYFKIDALQQFVSSQSLNHWDFLVSMILTSVSRSTQVLLLAFSTKPLHLTQKAVMADYDGTVATFYG